MDKLHLSDELIKNIEEKQNDLNFNNTDTPFTQKEIDELCKDYMYDYDGVEMTEYISEYADSKVSIYYDDIYENAGKFSEWTNDAIQEFGVSQNTKLHQILQMGEYKAYSDALYQNTEEMGLYCSLENSKSWIQDNKDLIDKSENFLSQEEKENLITDINNKIEEVSEKYVNDELIMGDYVKGSLEGVFKEYDFKYINKLTELTEGKNLTDPQLRLIREALNGGLSNEKIKSYNNEELYGHEMIEVLNKILKDKTQNKSNEKEEKPSIIEKLNRPLKEEKTHKNTKTKNKEMEL